MKNDLAKLEILKLIKKDPYGMYRQKDAWAQLLHDSPEAFIDRDVWMAGYGEYGSQWIDIVPTPARNVLIEAAVHDPYHFKSDLLREKEFVMEFYASANSQRKNLGRSSIDYLPTELKKDRDVVLLAVKNDGSNYMKSSRAKHIREDEEIIKAAISDDASVYREIPAQFRLRKDIVVLAVQSDPSILDEIGQFQDDIDVVTTAVERKGTALKYASYRLRQDRELCLKAILNDSAALAFVPEKYREDVEFSIHCNSSKKVTNFLKYCGSLCHDSAFAEMAIESTYLNYTYASYKDRLREDIYLPMLDRSNGLGYELLPDVLREDVKVFEKCFRLATSVECADEGAEDTKLRNLQKILLAAPPPIQMILIDEQTIRRGTNIPVEVASAQNLQQLWHFHGSYKDEFKKNVENAEKRLSTYMLTEKLQSELTNQSRSQQILKEAIGLTAPNTQTKPSRHKI